MLLAAFAAALSLTVPGRGPALVLKPCVVQGLDARCGTFAVPENHSRPHGRRIGLRVVVLPALGKPVRKDAFTYLAGGPGLAAASEMPSSVAAIWQSVRARHDVLLVDQRGTGGSHPLTCPEAGPSIDTDAERRAYVDDCLASAGGDPVQYGTRAAVDDLDAVRRALGYPQLDVYGTSYGATEAQMFLKRHPGSVRTLILDGATEMDASFYGRYAASAQRALAQVEKRCSADAACGRAFPGWRAAFGRLVRAWDEHPVANRARERITGTGLASVVHSMLIDANAAASIPLLVTRAAAGDYGPLNLQLGHGNAEASSSRQLMFWSIWCNEPWVGLDAKGPWHTDFDRFTEYSIAADRAVCAYVPKRAEPASAWRLPRSEVPVLVLAGGADPQDPIANFPKLRSSFPNSRALVVPGLGHAIGQYGCLGDLVGRFVDRGSAKGLDTSCTRQIVLPAFTLR